MTCVSECVLRFLTAYILKTLFIQSTAPNKFRPHRFLSIYEMCLQEFNFQKNYLNFIL